MTIYLTIFLYILAGILNVKDMLFMIEVYKKYNTESSNEKQVVINLAENKYAKLVYFFFWPYYAIQKQNHPVFENTREREYVDGEGELMIVTSASDSEPN